MLRYSGDVSLELRYTLLNGTQTAIRCANGQNKTAQTVYSDEVTDGVLAYTLALTGGDAASGVEISDVSCYQSGSGRTKKHSALMRPARSNCWSTKTAARAKIPSP